MLNRRMLISFFADDSSTTGLSLRLSTMPPNEDMHLTRTYKERTTMKKVALIPVIIGFSLAGCAQSALQADYGRSVQLMSENQVYDPTTLTRPSLAAVQGADPNMLDLAVT